MPTLLTLTYSPIALANCPLSHSKCGLLVRSYRPPSLQPTKAIAQVESLQPDMVLMDVRMPKMDGVAATQIICRDYPETRVLVLSTFDEDDYVSRAMQFGASPSAHCVTAGVSRTNPKRKRGAVFYDRRCVQSRDCRSALYFGADCQKPRHEYFEPH